MTALGGQELTGRGWHVALAGAPIRRRRHALVVGSNPTIMRILQTYLDREGLNVSVASPEYVRRAVAEMRDLGAASSMRIATPGCGQLSVVVVVLPPGGPRTEISGLLAMHEETASAPLVFVQSATVPNSVVVEKSISPFPVVSVPDLGGYVELAWPFRLREVFDAVAFAISADEDRMAASRMRRDDEVGRGVRNLTGPRRSGRPNGGEVAVSSLAVPEAGMVSA